MQAFLGFLERSQHPEWSNPFIQRTHAHGNADLLRNHLLPGILRSPRHVFGTSSTMFPFPLFLPLPVEKQEHLSTNPPSSARPPARPSLVSEGGRANEAA